MIKSITSFFLFMVLSTAAYANSITIDSETNSLTAPAGTEYRWFVNGKLHMGEISSSLEVCESGLYEVEFVNPEGNLETSAIRVAKTNQGVRKVFVISDSIAANYGTGYYPQMGWGQVLQLFFDDAKVSVHNRARGGRSSRSYYEEGLWGPSSGVAAPQGWTYVVEELAEGDFVFIQFGANDRNVSHATRGATPEVFQGFLRTYITETRNKGAIPVLLSPLMLNGTRNVYTESGSDYRGAMEEVATEMNVLFLDVNMLSLAFNSEYGSEYTGKFVYLGLESGEYPNFPDGIDDFTHIQEMGAYEVCNMIYEGLNGQAGHAEADILIDALKPRFQVDVHLDNKKAGLITQSTQLPEGCHVTLKHTIGAGAKFERWEDTNTKELISTERKVEFDMEARDYAFSAVTVDCLGQEGGQSYFDQCGTCIDSVVNVMECTKVISTACESTGEELNRAVFADITNDYYQMTTGSPDTLKYSVRSTAASGDYKLGLRYARSAAGQKVDVYWNDGKIMGNVELPEAGDAFLVKEFDLNLLKGNHYLKFVFPEVMSDLEIGTELISYNSNLYFAGCGFAQAPLSIAEVEGVEIFPNPSQDHFTIKLEKPEPYQILTMSGQVAETGICQGECTVGQSLSPGAYVLQVGGEADARSRVLVKQ